MTKHNFYTSTEVYAETFYQLPKIFFTNEKYTKLSSDAKIAFALLKERFNYSIKNNWCDEENRIYFIYTVKELCKILNCGTEKLTKIKKELEAVDLLYQKRLGVNLPNRLYLLKPQANADDVYLLTKTQKPIETSGFSEIEIPQNQPQTTAISGFSEIEIPQNQPQTTAISGFSEIENNRYIYNNLDTLKEDTKKTDTRKQQQEIYLLNHFAETHEEHSFLNRQNLELIGLFSDTLVDAENMQGIILRAKKDVEKKQDAVLILDDGYLHDETLAIQEDIRKTLHRIYQKRKTDSSIKNIDNYTYGAFKNLFEQKLGEWKMLTGETQNTISMHDWVK